MPALPSSGTPTPRTDKQAIRHAICDRCCWPECDQPGWPEAALPLCPRHAARVHLSVDDMIPTASS